MDPETKLNVGDRLVVMSSAEAWSRYGNARENMILFQEEGGYSLNRARDYLDDFEGRVATIIRADEVMEGHFHYYVDIDAGPGEMAWCPAMFSGYASDDEVIEPPDPMSMWYFLGIEENRNPRKGKRK